MKKKRDKMRSFVYSHGKYTKRLIQVSYIFSSHRSKCNQCIPLYGQCTSKQTHIFVFCVSHSLARAIHTHQMIQITFVVVVCVCEHPYTVCECVCVGTKCIFYPQHVKTRVVEEAHITHIQE